MTVNTKGASLSIVGNKKVESLFSDNINLEVIEELEHLLKLAKKGDLQVLIASGATSNNEIVQIRAGDWKSNINSMVGLLEDAKFEMLMINNGVTK